MRYFLGKTAKPGHRRSIFQQFDSTQVGVSVFHFRRVDRASDFRDRSKPISGLEPSEKTEPTLLRFLTHGEIMDIGETA